MFLLVNRNSKMPYYCTVPRCTSMAGKVKNVSFHQFPRDEELAKLWNKILKRGKPYTKYSKVCSLHFTQDDYTITNAGKYKGQWRTLRKDAIPSRNLPSETPVPYQRRAYASLIPSNNTVDPRLHQQMAQAIYVQTMLAMQAAGVGDVGSSFFNSDHQLPSPSGEEHSRSPSHHNTDQYNSLDHIDSPQHSSNTQTDEDDVDSTTNTELQNRTEDTHSDNVNVVSFTNNSFVNPNKVDTYKCNECSKCFKDPDVFLLHRRIHTKSPLKTNQNENFNASNSLDGNEQETLKANPILANLLKSGIPQGSLFGHSDLEVSKTIDTNVVSIESQIMAALAANMENYLRNLSTIMSSGLIDSRINDETVEDEENLVNNPDKEDSKDNNLDENGPNFDDADDKTNNCDSIKDLDDSQDSEGLVIDEGKC